MRVLRSPLMILAATALSVLAVAPAQSKAEPENLYVPSYEVGNRAFFTPTAWKGARHYWSAGLSHAGEPATSGPKWTSLYNGKDLAGWHAKDGKIEAWKANGDMISCISAGGGWLASDKEHGDFELRIDYRIPPGGNSGVGIRFPSAGDPAHVGMEIQVLDDGAAEYKNLDPAQYNGGIYYQSAAKSHPARKPGEWNHYDIRCEGPMVRVALNGVEIQNVNMDQFTMGRGGHMALAQRPRSGHVGMQSHGHQVDFKNIEIRELH